MHKLRLVVISLTRCGPKANTDEEWARSRKKGTSRSHCVCHLAVAHPPIFWGQTEAQKIFVQPLMLTDVIKAREGGVCVESINMSELSHIKNSNHKLAESTSIAQFLLC